MTAEDLTKVKPGKEIGDITHTLASGTIEKICTLNEGVFPESSDPASQNVQTYVATQLDSETEEVVVAVEPTQFGLGELDIDFRDKAAAQNPVLIGGVAKIALGESGVHVGELDPDSISVPQEVLEKAGFVSNEGTGKLELRAA